MGVMSYLQLENMCASSVYWGDTMIQELKRELESNTVGSKALCKICGDTLWEIVQDPKGGNMSVTYDRLNYLVQEVYALDSSEGVFHRGLFGVVEEPVFFLSEIVRSIDNVYEICKLAGYKEEVLDEVVNAIGANVGGYVCDQYFEEVIQK